MHRDQARIILDECLNRFRSWSYAELVEKIKATRWQRANLVREERRSVDDEQYFIEVNAFWDDRPDGNVRVMGDVTGAARGCLWGFLPLQVPDAVDSFIMAPDGSFVGE